MFSLLKALPSTRQLLQPVRWATKRAGGGSRNSKDNAGRYGPAATAEPRIAARSG